ncbi:hypothetical protein FRC09_002664 [Ceratobasidium sp. 395]|nr:hypothetical protein FRC09_002664 [Ceratobasidium sp. 395]
MENWYFNPQARKCKVQDADYGAMYENFHERCLPNYAKTPLIDAPCVAKDLSIGHLFIKDESSRLGLPAFKILGASWAIFHILCGRFKLDLSAVTFGDLRNHCRGTDISLWAATDGNHGRAVARMACLLGVRAHIFVPTAVSSYSRSLITSEGADVVLVAGDYDEAVRAAERLCTQESSPNAILVQDTAWEGYTAIPMQIVLGYTTLFVEIDEQLGSRGLGSPTVVVVPVGVGSLAQAAVRHYRSKISTPSPSILTVEPNFAACLFASLRAGEPTTVVTKDTIMAGLSCGTVSSLAWPDLLAGIDAATTVSDEDADKAVRDLASLGISSGPCGAATIAALRALMTGGAAEEYRELLCSNENAIIVAISSESSEVYLGCA